MKKYFIVIAWLVVFSTATLYCAEKKVSPKMKPALLVIDIQNAYLPYMAEQDRKSAMEVIGYIINLFRENGFPVVRIYHHDLEGGPKPGSEEFEFPKTIPIKDDDPKIIKTYGNAFNKTELEKILRDKGCNTLFLCGLSATQCVLATYYGAVDRDFNVFMIKNAIMSDDAALTKAVQEMCRTISISALRLLIENIQK
jgi:nicotinamidase-related amidase